MNRRITTIAICSFLFCIAASAMARDKQAKPGPLTGTWECTSHGGSRGDMSFTLTMEQAKDVVTGNVTSPMGSAEFTSASYKDKTLNIQIEGGGSDYVVTGTLKGGKLSGEWTHGEEKGTWEGKKQAPEAK